MEFSIRSGSPETQRSACVVVGVFEPHKLTSDAESVDAASRGYIADILRGGDMDGKLGATLMLHRVPGTTAERVLLVGLGKERDFDEAAYRRALGAAVRQLDDSGAGDGAVYLTGQTVRRHDATWRARNAAIVAFEVLYRFDRLKSKPDKAKRSLRKLSFCFPVRSDLAAGRRGLQEGIATGRGADLARDLGNLPGNICTPTYLAEQAVTLASAHGMTVEILERTDMETLGMHSLMSVARGSHQAPKLIVLQHRKGPPGGKPIVLIGKGITFDSGGISLKPGLGMDEMKFDMCGAASVLGAMRTAGELDLPLNLVAIVPATENMPGGSASKPGDIVTSMAGKTIEILNTDAEGRLILCDALTYAARFDPDCVIDVATLTGACVTALGHIATGLFSNHDGLAGDLLDAGQDAHDRAWRMPLWSDYQEQLKSNFADLANIGGPPAGSITAACFLSRFSEKYRWAHLDIAGTAWRSGKEKGATGRPVPLLSSFLLGRAAAKEPLRRRHSAGRTD